MMIAATGDMALVVDPGLIPPGRQTDPAPTDRDFGSSRLSIAVTNEVAVIAPTPGIDIRSGPSFCRASAAIWRQPGGLQTGCAPGVEHRQQDF